MVVQFADIRLETLAVPPVVHARLPA